MRLDSQGNLVEETSFEDVLTACRRILAQGSPNTAARLVGALQPPAGRVNELIALSNEDRTGAIRQALTRNQEFQAIAAREFLTDFRPILRGSDDTVPAEADVEAWLHAYRGRPEALVALFREASNYLDDDAIGRQRGFQIPLGRIQFHSDANQPHFKQYR
jgi:hypothetical protein